MAIGAGVENSLYTYAGQLFGALLFASSFSSIKKAVPGFNKTKSVLLDQYFNMSYGATTLIFALLIAAALYMLEIYDPYALEQGRISSLLIKLPARMSMPDIIRESYAMTVLSMKSWHPVSLPLSHTHCRSMRASLLGCSNSGWDISPRPSSETRRSTCGSRPSSDDT